MLAVCDLRQEVNAGAFETYFRAWGGNSADADGRLNAYVDANPAELKALSRDQI